MPERSVGVPAGNASVIDIVPSKSGFHVHLMYHFLHRNVHRPIVADARNFASLSLYVVAHFLRVSDVEVGAGAGLMSSQVRLADVGGRGVPLVISRCSPVRPPRGPTVS